MELDVVGLLETDLQASVCYLPVKCQSDRPCSELYMEIATCGSTVSRLSSAADIVIRTRVMAEELGFVRVPRLVEDVYRLTEEL